MTCRLLILRVALLMVMGLVTMGCASAPSPSGEELTDELAAVTGVAGFTGIGGEGDPSPNLGPNADC
jgi:hypothetical protein